MVEHFELRRDIYHDSVVLMQAGNHLRALDGIDQCLVAMATDLNIQLLDDLGFESEPINSSSTSGLIVAIRAESEDVISHAIRELEATLEARATSGSADSEVHAHRSLGAAVREAQANLAIISLPGPHVVPEAADALRRGANVMVFSDGVSIEEERELKSLAASRNLLVMGPDCGTARLGGIGLGFCNDVSSGEIGIVAASGTGAQHLIALLDARGMGISNIIGVGGRDMSDDIGGKSVIQGLRMLDEDPATTHIVLISKPPGDKTARRVDEIVKSLKTPVTMGLLGDAGVDLTKVARDVASARGMPFEATRSELSGQAAARGPLIGLFCGGTLATEARQIVGDALGPVDGLEAFETLAPAAIADHEGNAILDLGDDRMTAGRPHPMIDATIRREIIEALAGKPAPRLLFIDVVLGFCADADPAGAIANALHDFRRSHSEARVIASVVGATRDPQGLEAQWRTLADLGCDVYESNADAARAVAQALCGRAGG
ncbi:MAG: FdrA family protein [Gammaproteobacteria bacterium]|nr:FdrA family protein [Gammaproteobacteria bacterium]